MKTFGFGSLAALLLAGVIGCGSSSEVPAPPVDGGDDAVEAEGSDTGEEAAPAEGSGTLE